MNGLPLVIGTAFGAALLAMWVSVRVSAAPQSLRFALLHLGAALCLANAMPVIVSHIVVGLGSDGAAVALVLVVLPGFLYLWLSMIWLMKVLQRAMLMR